MPPATGEVVILDEAAKVASADLARVAVLVHEAGAKLVLVGDHAQLGAAEAGGLASSTQRPSVSMKRPPHRSDGGP